MGDFVLTSLRSPSLAGAVGRQIQGRLGGVTTLTGAFTGLVPFCAFSAVNGMLDGRADSDPQTRFMKILEIFDSPNRKKRRVSWKE